MFEFAVACALAHARFADRSRVSPRRASSFLARTRKEPKNTAPLSTTPLQSSGATCVVTLAGCAAQLALGQRRAAQTNGGKSDHEAFALCGANAALQAPRHRRSHRGGACASHQAERSDGPNGFRVPLVSAPATAEPWCGQLRRRAQLLRDLACGRLLERSALARSELGRTAPWLGRRRLPRSEAKGSQTAGAHFFGYFLVAEQESTSPAGANPGLCQTSKHIACNVNSTQAMGAAHP